MTDNKSIIKEINILIEKINKNNSSYSIGFKDGFLSAVSEVKNLLEIQHSSDSRLYSKTFILNVINQLEKTFN